MNNLLQLEKIVFEHDKRALCVFPNDIDELEQGLQMMGLRNRPVIVLIGGHIAPEHESAHRHALETIARMAEELEASVICGGTDVGVMAGIGWARAQRKYHFPLIGIAPEKLVTWPGVPLSHQSATNTEKAPLEPHHSHFVLVPGNEFGDESPWIVRAAAFISGRHHKSITILANGGEVSKKDIQLALQAGEPVIVLRGTGRLADEMAQRPIKNRQIRIVHAEDQQSLGLAIRSLLR